MQAHRAMQSIPPGTIIVSGSESFEIIAEIGRGGMGVVYKANQPALQRVVALKMLPPEFFADEHLRQRFVNEARLSATLQHPNIVRVYSLNLDSAGAPFLVMELVQGHTLAEVLKEHGPLTSAQFERYFDQILSALAEAHSKGWIHRDIKPSNVMVTADDTIKLMDFGIAKDVMGISGITQSVTQTGALIGSPWYMSPEQCRSEALDTRSDLYSVGCVMYECLSGKLPFAGENAMEVMYKHLHEQLDTTEELKLPHHSALVMRALAKNKEDRFESAQSMRGQLLGSPTTQRKRSRKRAKLAAPTRDLLVATAVVLGLAALVVLPQLRQSLPRMDGRQLVESAETLMAERATRVKDFSSVQSQDMLTKVIELYTKALQPNYVLPPDLENRATLALANALVDRNPKESERLLLKTIANLSGFEQGPRDSTPARLHLARLYLSQQRWEEALKEADIALAGVKKASHAIATHLPNCYQIKAEALSRLNRLKEAEECWVTSKPPADSEGEADMYVTQRDAYATWLVDKKLFAEAIGPLKDIITIAPRRIPKLTGEEQADLKEAMTNGTASAYRKLALCYTELHDAKAVIALAPAAFAAQKQQLPYPMRSEALLHEYLAQAFATVGDSTGMVKEFDKEIACYKKISDPPPTEIVHALGLKFWNMRGAHMHKECLQCATDGLQIMHAGKFPHELHVHFTYTKGLALIALHRFAEAEQLLREADDAIFNKHESDDATSIYLVLGGLAETLDRQGRRDEAAKYYARLIEAADNPKLRSGRPDMATNAHLLYEQFKKGAVSYFE